MGPTDRRRSVPCTAMTSAAPFVVVYLMMFAGSAMGACSLLPASGGGEASSPFGSSAAHAELAVAAVVAATEARSAVAPGPDPVASAACSAALRRLAALRAFLFIFLGAPAEVDVSP